MLISSGQVLVNGRKAVTGQIVDATDSVKVDGKLIEPKVTRAVIFNKPAGYVCSRQQQGNTPTIYEILPHDFGWLNPVGRLDKDSTGLMILSNDGELIQALSHPSSNKWKRYYIETSSPLSKVNLQKLNEGVQLDDGISRLVITPREKGYEVRLQEGRNRQIRRSIEAIGGKVTKLHREAIGEIEIGSLKAGEWAGIDREILA